MKAIITIRALRVMFSACGEPNLPRQGRVLVNSSAPPSMPPITVHPWASSQEQNLGADVAGW
jgi:hypothetical protein